MSNDLTTIEDDVVKHLDAHIKGLKVQKYSGEFDATAANKLSFSAPCLFVSFLGSATQTIADGGLSGATKWAAFLVLHQVNKRNKAEKQLLSNTLAVLNGSSLGLKALPIRQLSFEQILIRSLEKGKLSAWSIRWEHDLKLFTPVSDEVQSVEVLIKREGEDESKYKVIYPDE